MGRKKIVAGNWKMNTTLNEALDLASGIKNTPKNTEVIIFPPFPFLKTIIDSFKTSNGFYVGAQNCNANPKGAFTGEVSAPMLSSIGCDYVMVGHSERRNYFKETNEELMAKINQALQHHLKVIFCFGEQLHERKSNQHFNTVETQLTEVLKHFPLDKISNLVLAYEPVWAIGTGETASPQQAQEMHAFIRKVMTNLFSAAIANDTSILYGGSCNAQNARELFACEDVDGGLIGGASLKIEDFTTIIHAFT
jgi:triosephosphate isomerase (TIM)